MTKRRFTIAASLVLTGVLGGCSAPPNTSEGPVEVATAFVHEYDAWAQDGYADPIPESLRELVSSDMLKVLKEDQSWYLSGGVEQHGAVELIESELIEDDSERALVTITLDAGDVSVTAEGEETFVDYSAPIITRFNLERTDEWRISSTESDE